MLCNQFNSSNILNVDGVVCSTQLLVVESWVSNVRHTFVLQNLAVVVLALLVACIVFKLLFKCIECGCC